MIGGPVVMKHLAFVLGASGDALDTAAMSSSRGPPLWSHDSTPVGLKWTILGLA